MALVKPSKPIMDLLSGCRVTPCADFAPLPVSAEGGASYLSPSKSEGSTCWTAHDLSAFSEPLQNRIYEREWILDASKVIAPPLKSISHLNSTHVLPLRIVKHSPHELRPRDFRLHLLPKRVLDSNRRRLQLRNFHVQLISRMILASNLFLNFLQRFLQCFCHCGPSLNYTSRIHIVSICIKHYF